MSVETKTASLSTLAVTINALHVNGKQMTLAVFRQLPEESLCCEDGTIDDHLTWWGSVRYKIKDEGDKWMVVEYEGELLRCPYIDTRQPYWMEKSLKGRVEQAEISLKRHDNNYAKNQLNEAMEALDNFNFECGIQSKQQKVMEKWGEYPQLFIAV